MNTTMVELPSEGRFYPPDNPLSSGEIEIKYMTAAEEDILTDQNLLRRGIAVDKLIEAVIVSDINMDDLLVGDKGAVLMATRILAYGPEYRFEIECPSCGETAQKSIDLTEVESKEIPFDEFEENQTEFQVDLPVTGKTATVQLLTHAEDRQIKQELKRVKRGVNRKSLKGPSVGTQVTTRLKHYIVALDGDRDPNKTRTFVDQMPARDSLELRRFISKINPDIDLSFDFICDWCGYEEVMNIPLDANFLFPSTEL